MDKKIHELSVITYFGRQYTLSYEEGQSIKSFKDQIKLAIMKDVQDDTPDFIIIYCGKKLTKDDEVLSQYLKEGVNTIYTMASQVHGGCQPSGNFACG